MLDNIIKFSIKNKLIIVVFVLGLIGWGTVSLRDLPIDAVPDITNNQVQIITSAPSQSAQDIERLVSFPIELAVANIPELEEVRSFSRFGLSVVTVVFKDQTDIYWARQQISERLADVKSQIPAGIGVPEMAPVTTGLGEIYQYSIFPTPGYEDSFSSMELRSLQDWVVRRQLLGIEGVADVSSFGGFLKQYEVALNPEKLKALGISIAEVVTALEKNNENTGGAYIDKNPRAYFIRSQGLIEDVSAIEKIAVKHTQNGTPICIKDIATVKFGHATRYGAMTRNGDGEVVGGIVMMLKGANSSQVIEQVKKRVEQIQNSLPEGVVIKPFLDRSKLVNKAIGTVSKNLIEGALIVIFILVLLLGNFRAGLIVASVIPLAMLFAISLMKLFGVSGNLMSLGAIDFGIIVDGSVIIVEATMHFLSKGKQRRLLTQEEMDREVYQAASKIRTSAAFGELIILIVYLPILALVGIEGKMFKPMAITVSFAILGAFLLSLTYVPMMSAWFLSKDIQVKQTFSDRLMQFFRSKYEPLLVMALKHKRKVVIAALGCFIGSLGVFFTMGSEFIPSLDEGDLAVQTVVSTGSSLTHSIDITNKSSSLLMEAFPDEIEEIVSRIGSSEIPTDPMPIEASDMIVILKDKSQWTRAASKTALTEKMQALLDEKMVGVEYGFQQPIQMRFNELMTGARQDVVLKIYGENLEELVKYANGLGNIIPNIKGAEDLYIEKMTGLEQIVIQYNRERIALFGLNVSEVNKAINAAFAGQFAGVVYEGERRFDLVVRMAKNSRSDITDLRNLYIATPYGEQVPLASVAKVTYKSSINQIQRDDAKRRITIGFNVRGRDVASIVKELKAEIATKMKFEPGYYITYGGTFKNMEEAQERLAIAVPIALLLIFFLLYLTFRSLKYSVLIFTAIPMSAIGGIIALYLRNMPFSISAGIGFIALFGVAVLNGIVLITEFNSLKEEGGWSISEVVRKGCLIRLRPVLMTAAVASFGFFPMALSTSAGAEVQKPLATVVIGGLLSATLLTLIVLPVVYVWVEDWKIPNKPKKVLLGVLLLIGVSEGYAQEIDLRLSEEEAVVLALKQAVQLKTADIAVANRKSAIQKAFALAPMSLQYQNIGVGLNTREKEWTANQNFGSIIGAFRSFDTAKKQFILQQTLKSLQKRELIREVRIKFQDWHYKYARYRLLKEQQAVSTTIKKISAELHSSGEIGGVENDLTSLQYLETQAAKTSAYRSYIDAENALKNLLQIQGQITPKEQQPKRKSQLLKNESLAGVFSELTHQKEAVFNSQIALSKSGYFPQLTAGVIKRVTGDAGFTGFQVGLQLPLSFWSTRAKVTQSKLRKEEVTIRNKAQLLAISNESDNVMRQLRYLDKELVAMEEMALKAKSFVAKIALAYKSGEIDAYKYNQSFRSYYQVMNSYLLLVNNYNLLVIAYQYYNHE